MGKTGFHFCGSCSKYTRDPQGPASILRRGGRVVECTALEMRHTGNRIGGSNPSLSASYEFQRISANTHERKKPNVYGVSFSHYRYAHHAHKSGHRRREAVEKPIRTPCQSAYRPHTGRRRGRRSRGRAATTTRRIRSP